MKVEVKEMKTGDPVSVVRGFIHNVNAYYEVEHIFRSTKGSFLNQMYLHELRNDIFSEDILSKKSKIERMITELKWLFREEDISLENCPPVKELKSMGDKVKEFTTACREFTEACSSSIMRSN